MARSVSVLVAAVALATSSFVHAAEVADNRECVREMAPGQIVARPRPLALAELFAIDAGESVQTENGVEAPGPIEVVIVRTLDDGTAAMVCVDSEAAAKRFLEAPADKVATKKAKEQ
ncbi:MAG TPA: hypothetical protein VEK79_26115 [Thermoanaerobaculia bacterium]|nr:hypothetical protein [Thermoanaerobaculia bacterium]